ncbi:MAG: hypothetical protein AB7S57_10570 [Acetobacteraceae bacterium]
MNEGTMQYRLYLLTSDKHIRAGQSFAAQDDSEATAIGATLYDACSDEFAGYEVWRGPVMLKHGRPAGITGLEEIIQARQQSLLDLEDSLQRSFACVHRSRRLLETTDRLRDGLQQSARTPPDLGRVIQPLSHDPHHALRLGGK